MSQRKGIEQMKLSQALENHIKKFDQGLKLTLNTAAVSIPMTIHLCRRLK